MPLQWFFLISSDEKQQTRTAMLVSAIAVLKGAGNCQEGIGERRYQQKKEG
jgi:hypothetical protein